MSMRRVVTGTRDGRSVVVSDTPVTPVTSELLPSSALQPVPGTRGVIWGSDVVPTLPSDGTPPPLTRYIPAAAAFASRL